MLIDTGGAVVGQVNGLSVLQLGDATFGRPDAASPRACAWAAARWWTSSARSSWAGPIHSKGVLILCGLPRRALRAAAAAGALREPRLRAVLRRRRGRQRLARPSSARCSRRSPRCRSGSRWPSPARSTSAAQVQADRRRQREDRGLLRRLRRARPDRRPGRAHPGRQRPAPDAARRTWSRRSRRGRFHVFAVRDRRRGLELLTGVPAGERRRTAVPEGSVNRRVEDRWTGWPSRCCRSRPGPMRRRPPRRRCRIVAQGERRAPCAGRPRGREAVGREAAGTRTIARMGTITTAVELPYPIADVFRVATRIPDLPRWLPEVVSAELLDPSLRVGSRVRLKLGPATGGAEITGTVTELVEPVDAGDRRGLAGRSRSRCGRGWTRSAMRPRGSRWSWTWPRRRSSGSSPRRRSVASRRSCRRRWSGSARSWTRSRADRPRMGSPARRPCRAACARRSHLRLGWVLSNAQPRTPIAHSPGEWMSPNCAIPTIGAGTGLAPGVGEQLRPRSAARRSRAADGPVRPRSSWLRPTSRRPTSRRTPTRGAGHASSMVLGDSGIAPSCPAAGHARDGRSADLDRDRRAS